MKRKKKSIPHTAPGAETGAAKRVSSGQRHLWLLGGIVALCAILVYLPALGNSFIPDWDDQAFVTGNLHIRSMDFRFLKWAFFNFNTGNWHPFTWISHAFDYAVWGPNPFGHHLTNVLMHAANSGLVAVISFRLIKAHRDEPDTELNMPRDLSIGIAALATGILFAVHPLHVESVAWVSERKDLLSALFFLLSILCYTTHVRTTDPDAPDNRHLYRSMLLFGCALMSKPMAVSLPAVLLILDWYPFRRISSAGTLRRAVLEKVPFLLIGVFSSIITIMAQSSGGAMSLMEKVPFWPRLLIAVRSLFLYLAHLVAPLSLSPYYPYPPPERITLSRPEYFIPMGLLVCLLALVFLFRKKIHRLILAGGIYYVVTLLPVIGLIQVGRQAMADRYAYLPSIAPLLIAALIGARAWGEQGRKRSLREASAIVGVAAVLVLSILSMRQIGTWKNSSTFWDALARDYGKAIAANSGDYFAYYNRGCIYYRNKKYDEAMLDLNKAIELNPGFADAYVHRGNIFMRNGNIDRAILEYDTALSKDKALVFAYVNRAMAHEDKGDLAKAIEDYGKALSLNPARDVQETVNISLGDLYLKSGRLDMALTTYQAACEKGLEAACEKAAFPFVPTTDPPGNAKP